MGTFQMQTIHDLDEERRRRETDRMTTVVGRPGLTSSARLKFAMGILSYNQSFVTFVDGKANSLLLVNSIFLATAASAGLTAGLSLAAVGVAALAVLACLGVVWARSTPATARERGQVVFYDQILKRRSAGVYEDDFMNAGPDELVASTVRQVYTLAGVVDRKFRAYRWAQSVTVVSAALWLSQLLVPALSA